MRWRGFPTTTMDWDEWKSMGMRIYAATRWRRASSCSMRGRGSHRTSTSMKTRSRRGRKFKARRRTAPASRRSSRSRASTAGRRAVECAPTYAAADGDVDAARREIRARDRQVLGAGRCLSCAGSTDCRPSRRELMRGEPGSPPVEAMRVDTGIGKTEQAIASYAARRQRGAAPRRGPDLHGGPAPAERQDRGALRRARRRAPRCSAAAAPTIRTIRGRRCASTRRGSRWR